MSTQNWIVSLGWALTHFLWQGAAWAALLWLILKFFRGAAQRYAAGCLVLMLMALTPAATLSRRTALPSAVLPPKTGGLAQGTPSAASSRAPALWGSDRLPAGGGLERVFSVIVAGWAIGVAVFALRLIRGMRQLKRMRESGEELACAWGAKFARLCSKAGLSRPVRLVQSALVEVPTVIGWLKPMVLLPASSLTGLSADELEAILLHELAHVRRHDYLVNSVQVAIETLLFYHPAVWWVSNQIREAREHCCDDCAAELSGSPGVLAMALAKLEEQRSMPILSLGASSGSLVTRIRRLAAPEQNGSGGLLLPACVLITVTVLALVLHPGAAIAKESQELHTRTFRVKGTNFVEALFSDTRPERRDLAAQLQNRLKAHLAKLGSPLTNVYLNVERETLFAKGTVRELDELERIVGMMQDPPQVLVTTRLIDWKQDAAFPRGARLLDKKNHGAALAVLTAEETKLFLDSLKFDILSAPRISNLSGRHATVSISGGKLETATGEKTEAAAVDRSLQVDMISHVLGNGHELQVDAGITQTVRPEGKPGVFSVNAVGYIKMNGSGRIFDGQSLVLKSDLPGSTFATNPIVAVVTAQIIDSKGQPIFRSDHLPFDPRKTPMQP